MWKISAKCSILETLGVSVLKPEKLLIMCKSLRYLSVKRDLNGQCHPILAKTCQRKLKYNGLVLWRRGGLVVSALDF